MRPALRAFFAGHGLLRSTRACFGLILLLSSYFSFSQGNTFPLTTKATKILIDSLCNQINKFYVEKEAASKITGYIREKYKMGAYNKIEDPHQLAAMLTNDVLVIRRDEHFHIEYNPALSNEVSGNIDDVPKMVAEKLKNDRAKNFGFKKVETLCGNIGYLELSGFSRLNQYSRATADAAMKLLANSNALIIDLRYGVGGSPEMMTHIISHFFREKTHVSDIYIRSENATLPYYTSPDSSTTQLTKIPIYVLTSYKTFSAAEGLAFALQTLKRATVVGEVTRGGAHTVTYRPISSGFVADIPFGKATSPVTQATWEKTGIQPDIQVPAEDAMDKAQELIFRGLLNAAIDSSAKNNIRFQRDLLFSMNKPFVADTGMYEHYAGRYGAFTVTKQGKDLFYQKTGKAKFPLVPMKADWFRPLSNESFVVEFQRDMNRKVVKIITRYEDGRTEEAPKSVK